MARSLSFNCHALLAVTLIAWCPVRAAAQDPADRVAVEQLRDSLGDANDSSALLRLETGTIDIAKRDRDNPLIHLRLGFIAYRLGEVTKSKSHFDDAAGEFEWASELRPAWPYPWYGLGLAELAQGEHSSVAIENLRQWLGKDYLSKAARAFARAAQADPGFARATIDLVTTALAQHIQPRLEVALEAVRLAAGSPAGQVPDVQLARGRVEREVGEADSALVAFSSYLRLGGDSGVGLFELSRTQFFAGRKAAAETSYDAGVRAATSAPAVAMYRRDLQYLATPAEQAAFDALATPAARADWLVGFWARRDVAEGRDAGERLAEHNRRWFYAHRNFRLVSRHRHYDITETYRSDQAEFDDRGIIYLRHGEPDLRATFVTRGDTVEPNLSWLYHRPGGDLVFHFVARDDVQDYKLVESLSDALGFRGAILATGTPSASVVDLYQSREQFGPAYQRVARGGALAGTAISDERAQGRRSIAVGTTSDSYMQRFASILDATVSGFVAGTDTGPGQALHVVFAVPADQLTPQPGSEGGVIYPLRFRLLVSTLHNDLLARLDTMRVFGARAPLHAPSFLTGRLALPVPPGWHRYRLVIETADQSAGEVVVSDSLEVPRLDGAQFTASDVVIGRAGAGLAWIRPGAGPATADTVLLNPLDRFPTDGVAELYYEVFGLAAGASYHTEVRLEKQGGHSLLGGLFGGRRPPVLLAFDALADGPVTRVHRAVNLRGVSPGTYRLSIALTDPATGRRLTRSHMLTLTPSRAGP